MSFFINHIWKLISRTKNDRNKQISDSESRHLEDYICLRGSAIYKSNIHAQRDAQKRFYLPLYYLKGDNIEYHLCRPFPMLDATGSFFTLKGTSCQILC